MKKVKIGLLPLFMQLYEEYLQWMHPRVDNFYEKAAKQLEKQGVEVMRNPLCRVESEFRAAIEAFETQGCDVVVTLNLSYSPSKQSDGALKDCKLPIIVMDATEDYVVVPEEDNGAIDFDQGIHGVQDLCNMMVRNGVKFEIFAGHLEYSDVCKQVADCARAKVAAKYLSQAKVGLIGEPFPDMGDFRVPYDEMKRDIGVDVLQTTTQEIGEYAKKVTQERIDALYEEDKKRFIFESDVTREQYDEVTRASLAVKDWYEDKGLDAYSVNFMSASPTSGLRHMVFDRACRAMEDGIGYAGEGDTLTASLVGSLLKVWEDTSFAEMFAPNWRDNVLLLCHMGEYNLRIAGKTPTLISRPYPFNNTGNPYALMTTMKAGKAVILNLAPVGPGKYNLIAVPGEMQQTPAKHAFDGVVNGWFKPDCDLRTLLKTYSKNGGTHHSAMVYGVDAESFAPIAEYFGWNFMVI